MPGAPNNHAPTGNHTEDCAQMLPSQRYMWDDADCGKEQLYVCTRSVPADVLSTPSTQPEGSLWYTVQTSLELI